MTISREQLPGPCQPLYDVLREMDVEHHEAILLALEYGAIGQKPRPPVRAPETPQRDALVAAFLRRFPDRQPPADNAELFAWLYELVMPQEEDPDG